MPPILNPQHSAFNQHARASFVHLPNANDRVLQARDPIHARQGLVLAVAPGEDDGALATDVDDGAVSELDGTLHRPVKPGEHVAVTRHVVRRARVEVPALEVIIVATARAEERLSLGLVQVD
jgi:glutamine phosphoribosylpyrophosphate amidotransferase